MRKTTLGRGGAEVSAICLGAMRFGTATPEATSREILDLYLEAGGTFIDTANVYAVWEKNGKGGESEALLGRWMRERGNRNRIFLATKVGSRLQKSGFGLRAAQIETELKQSLTRLGVSHVDLLYSHFDDRQTPLEETLAAYDRLVKAGEVRMIGASNFRAWRLEAALRVSEGRGWAAYCCVQQRYSYALHNPGTKFGMQQPTDEDLLDLCASRGLPILAYSPLLGGCYGREDRKLPPNYAGPRNEARLACLKALAAEKGIPPNQLVLAWMLNSSAPNVIPIAAASTAAQMKENLAALEVRLSAEELQRLNSAGGPQQ